MALTYKPETTQKKIAEFKEFLDDFTDILYNKNYVPDNIYGRDKLYRVFREVKDWLKWQKTEKESGRIFNEIRNVLERDSEKWDIPNHVDKDTFCALLHLGEITEKLIDGTYHLAKELVAPNAPLDRLDIMGHNQGFYIIVANSDGEQVDNCRWLQYNSWTEDRSGDWGDDE